MGVGLNAWYSTSQATYWEGGPDTADFLFRGVSKGWRSEGSHADRVAEERPWQGLDIISRCLGEILAFVTGIEPHDREAAA